MTLTLNVLNNYFGKRKKPKYYSKTFGYADINDENFFSYNEIRAHAHFRKLKIEYIVERL